MWDEEVFFWFLKGIKKGERGAVFVVECTTGEPENLGLKWRGKI